jgi:DNA 3'-phosphatase
MTVRDCTRPCTCILCCSFPVHCCLKTEGVAKQPSIRRLVVLTCWQQVFCSLLKDRFRKPETGTWELLNRLNGDQSVAVPSSLFVGDAAGRPGDFSDSDQMFAAAIGLKFFDETTFFKASHPIT